MKVQLFMWLCLVFNKLFRYFLILVVLFFLQNKVYAAGSSIAPAIIDLKAGSREIIKQSITLKNMTAYKLNLYPIVNNINAQNGVKKFSEPVVADLSSSLANWLHLSRGVIELASDEIKKIDFEINVNMSAKPGVYHAVIAFAPGSTREEAESRMAEASSLILNLEVLDDAREKLQLKKFASAKIFYADLPVGFNYLLENIGNRTLEPRGRVIIYNRRGEEVTILNLEQNFLLAPGESRELTSIWENGKALGRYKAFLDINYGRNDQGAIQDTVFFWIVPWKKVAFAFGSVSIFAMFITLVGYSRFSEKRK